ncbi:hypothetical protein HY449_03650 [Candidatus Pacearchaeota archaeon]|nr:hypothetical protein [Candidatus Pacearchaeota archaeon]
MSDFLFHKVSEEEKERIRKEAKEIMDNFSKKLSRAEGKISENFVERAESERKEGEGKNPDNDFRRRVFENAPNKNADFIIGDKKGW